MDKGQVQRLKQLRDEVRNADTYLKGKRADLRKVVETCDHHYPDKRSAMKTISTHDMTTCGGYKECAICAGEQRESFVEVCQICERDNGMPFFINPPLAKAIRL